MSDRFKNPSSLRRALRDIIVVVIASGGTVAMSFSCGGEIDQNLGPCKASPPAVVPTCTAYEVPVTGDLRLCGFTDSGGATPATCSSLCGGNVVGCGLVTDASAVRCSNGCAVDGRRPEGLADLDRPMDLASSFASLAYFEAASVDAFAILGRELAHHGAPAALLRAISRARSDEVRHAAMARRAALMLGATPIEPTVETHDVRSLEDIALENAREGCVRETFGALLGEWQSAHAPVTWIRDHYATLARDESRHAALSWRLHTWLMSQLSPAARARVIAELNRAITTLVNTLDDPNPQLADLGLPSAQNARALANALFSPKAAAA